VLQQIRAMPPGVRIFLGYAFLILGLLGLSTLTIPAVPLALLAAQPIGALIAALLGVMLLFGLTRPEVRTWLSEP
jgi:hypothetical protein